jgi:DNA repair exonuclease SbcCD ATPase subunit
MNQQLLNEVQSVRRLVDRYQAQRHLLIAERDAVTRLLEKAREDSAAHAEAVPVLMKIAQAHRKLSLEKVDGLTTAALRAVFEYPYDFSFKQEEKRGQVELRPVVIDDGDERDPMASMGGGILDVISISLRPILMSLQADKADPVLIMDEPARQVNSIEAVKNLSNMIRKLSEVLKLQVIMVTNRPALAQAADRIFEVKRRKKLSEVVVVKDAGRRND